MFINTLAGIFTTGPPLTSRNAINMHRHTEYEIYISIL